ncbi:MAG: hypothetical protein KAR39_01580 [Thermoplasmata archaeon]|nr:hypothetical protein [Thermoplasmata archaeon]
MCPDTEPGMNTSSLGNRILFDERNSDVMRRKFRKSRFLFGMGSILFSLPSIALLLYTLDIFPIGEQDLLLRSVLFIGSIIFLGVGIVAFLASLSNEYTTILKNGIELRRFNRLGYRNEFIHTQSIVRLYIDVTSDTLDAEGSGVKLMVLELKDSPRRRYRILKESDFVEKERFLDVVSKIVSIDSKPRNERELLRLIQS